MTATVDETSKTLQGQIDELHACNQNLNKYAQGLEIRIDRQLSHIKFLESQLDGMRRFIGANGHLTSPKPNDGLVSRIRRWLHR